MATPTESSTAADSHEVLIGSLPTFTLDDLAFDSVLGSGHNSCVRRCVIKSVDKTVAVKARAIISSDSVRSILNTMNEQIQIESPNIVQIFSIFTSGTSSCYKYSNSIIIVSEFCNYGSVDDLRNKLAGCAVPVEYLPWLASQAFQGMAHLHRLKLHHGNIKPSNILITIEGDVKLTDRAVPADYGNETCTHEMFKCAMYIAPEVLMGEAMLNCDSDVWSIGMVLYVLSAAADDTFSDMSFPAIFARIVDSEPPRLDKTYPLALADFVACCLTKEVRASTGCHCKDALAKGEFSDYPCHVLVYSVAGEIITGPLVFDSEIHVFELVRLIRKSGKMPSWNMVFIAGTKQLLDSDVLSGGSGDEPLSLTAIATSGPRAITHELLCHPFLVLGIGAREHFVSWLTSLT